MQRTILILTAAVFAILPLSADPLTGINAVVNPTQGVKAVTAAGTPVRLATASTPATRVAAVEFYARKNTTTANTGNIYIGFSSTGGQNYRVLAPEGSWTLSLPGKKIDLFTVYVDAATNGDAVVWSALN